MQTFESIIKNKSNKYEWKENMNMIAREKNEEGKKEWR
jgi:hypothetical protein